MAWDAINTVPAMHGKSLTLRELFAKTANAALDKGQTEEEAIFSGMSAVKIQEKKNQPPKVVAPKVPAHLAAVRSYQSPYDMVSKAAVDIVPISAPTVMSAEFDNQGYLTLLFSDNTTIKTKNKAVQENITQNVVISDNTKPFVTAMKEPTGFETRDTSTISFNDSNRTFTISAVTPSIGFNVWLHATEITRYSESVQITDESGIHFIYFDYPDNQLKSTTIANSYLFLNTALVALVYWRADQQKHIYFADERHGIVMDGATHQHLHLSIGAQYRSGLALNNMLLDQNGNSDSHAKFACLDGAIADEDITITITDNAPQDLALIAKLPVFYRIGSNSIPNWYSKSANSFAMIRPSEVSHYTGTTRPAYNYYNGSGWALAEVPNNEFFLIHVLATNDVEHPIVAISGNTYNTKSAARTGAKSELKELTGLPFLEFVKIGSIIVQTANTYTNTPKSRIVSTDTGEAYVDYRTTLAAIVLF
jgi:hypothetical protein